MLHRSLHFRLSVSFVGTERFPQDHVSRETPLIGAPCFHRAGKQRSEKVERGNARRREAPAVKDAARPLGGGFKCAEMGLRFRALKARKPLPPFGRIRKEPFRARKGFLRLFLLVAVFRRRRKHLSEDKKGTPRAKRSSRNLIPAHTHTNSHSSSTLRK